MAIKFKGGKLRVKFESTEKIPLFKIYSHLENRGQCQWVFWQGHQVLKNHFQVVNSFENFVSHYSVHPS